MTNFLLGMVAGWVLLILAVLILGAVALRGKPEPRRSQGLCGVPDCSEPAGHWQYVGKETR